MTLINQVMTIQTLCKGQMLEQLQAEIDKAIGNILDTDTDQKKRVVSLKVELAPNDIRTEIEVVFTVSSKLAGPPPGGDVVRFERGVPMVQREQLTIPLMRGIEND